MENKKKSQPLMVTIQCFTYNHEPYIRQCLEGFVMQKANFRFEAIVHDDASTDGTADIIREYAEKYPDIIKPIYETENQYSKHDGSLRRIMDAHTHGKYVALCEGDDYWIDPLKLQKQVDILESNPDCGVVYATTKKLGKKGYEKSITAIPVNFKSLLVSNPVSNLTTCCCKSILDAYTKEIKPMGRRWLMGDYPQWLYFSLKSRILFINEPMSVYRVLDESACHSKNIEKRLRFNKSEYDIKKFFIEEVYKGNDKPQLLQLIKNILFAQNILAYLDTTTRKAAFRYWCEEMKKVTLKTSLKQLVKIAMKP